MLSQTKNPRTELDENRKPSIEEPFASLAFKIATDPYVGRLCFTRAYSGVLDSGSYVLNTRTGKKERNFQEFSKCMQISKIKLINFKPETSLH